MTAVDDTSVTVSWNDLIIPDFSIDYYTVVYSRVSGGGGRENGEMKFPTPATSGVITDLDPTAIYQFQVFATATVGDIPLNGENSTAVEFGIGE